MPSLLLNGLIIIGSLSQLSISVDQEGDGQQAGGQPAPNPAHHCGSGLASEREQAAGEVQHAVHHRPSEVPGGFAGAGTELDHPELDPEIPFLSSPLTIISSHFKKGLQPLTTIIPQ